MNIIFKKRITQRSYPDVISLNASLCAEQFAIEVNTMQENSFATEYHNL